MFYVEWVPDLNYRKGLFLPVPKVESLIRNGLSGHTTVYQFDKNIADHVKELGSSKGLDKYPCSSRVLVIDNDDGDKGLIELSSALRDMGLRHWIYASGGKGHHVYVPLTERMSGIHVPYSQKQWILSMGLGDLADTGVYHAGHLIACPGRIHPKTQVRKSFLREVPGNYLTIPYTEPEPMGEFDFHSDIDPLLAGISGLQDLIEQPGKGNRHIRIWSVSQQLAKAGMPRSTAEAIMIFLNSTWEDPKQDDEVITAVGQAYQQSRE